MNRRAKTANELLPRSAAAHNKQKRRAAAGRTELRRWPAVTRISAAHALLQSSTVLTRAGS